MFHLSRKEILNRATFTWMILSLLFGCITFTYWPSIQNGYMADDYILLSQGMQQGFLKSLIIPFGDHPMPLFRLMVQGLHVVFGQAAPMHAFILAFHILNSVLAFKIVRRVTDSLLLAFIASFTFGLSFQAGCVLWINPCHEVIAQSFLFLMYIWFDRYWEENCGAQKGAASQESAGFGENRLRSYYLGLAFFVLALGFSTYGAIAAPIFWLFLYLRVLQSKRFQTGFRFHWKISAPFVLILSVYLGLRTYLNHQFLTIQGSLFQQGSSIPVSDVSAQIQVIRSLPAAFYTDYLRHLALYFPDHYVTVMAAVVLLMIKELMVKRRSAILAAMWLFYAVFVSAVPVFARASFALGVSGSANYVLPWWYFYCSAAGMSIAIAILLRPPAVAERLAKTSSMVRITLGFSIIVILVFLNIGKMKDIRAESRRLAGENRRFAALIKRYELTMQAFLASPAYSLDSKYVFPDLPAANKSYSAGWGVLQRDIFNLCFSDVRNITFIDISQPYDFQYVWTPSAVMQKYSSLTGRDGYKMGRNP